jgi:hypothetical protein
MLRSTAARFDDTERFLMNARTLFSVVGLCTLACASSAQADVIVDRISNPALWTDAGPLAQQNVQALTRANGAASFIGNGQQLESISMLFGNGINGTFNVADVSLFDFRFMLFSSVDDFVSDPYGLNRPAGWSQLFTTPSNSDWLTVVGTTNTRELRRADFDLTALNINVTAGQNYLAAVTVIANQGGGGGFIGFARPGGIGTELDWYASNTLGPATLDSLNAPQDYLAYRITTVVPSPGAASLIVLGGIFAARRRR